jgi:hypothetical protein
VRHLCQSAIELDRRGRHNCVACALAVERPTPTEGPPEDTAVDTASVYMPDDLRLEPGEVSIVNRKASDSAEDIFRCTGCKDAACQVRNASIRSSSVLKWKGIHDPVNITTIAIEMREFQSCVVAGRGPRAVTRRLGDLKILATSERHSRRGYMMSR